jgi:outer membrane protein OmpA-like peptidoglycan-associated protein
VLELIATDPQFSALDQAVRAAGLGALAADAEPYTAFAPSNEAFEALTPAEAGALNADPELIAAVLENHVLAEQRSLAELADGPLTMLGGGDVVVTMDAAPDGAVTLTGADATVATVVDGDIVLSDGTVHVVDRLLFPEGLELPPTRGDASPAPGGTVLEELDEEALARRAAALQIDLDGVVRATPIGFAPESVEVSELSGPTFDRIAEAIQARPGVVVVVRGHTDTGDTDLVNLFVSTARAEAVVDALAARGVPRDRLRAVGFGATEPVLVDGVEDEAASRRVDFAVETE